MTNFDKWRLYTDGLISPDSYINFGFYYMISAALQRRVWIGPEHSPLYPNLYIILVGDPGVGKGLVIKQLTNILTHHKMSDPLQDIKNMNDMSTIDKQLFTETAKEDFNKAKESEPSSDKLEKPLLLPMAADATTYEALVRSLAKSIRRKNIILFDEQLQRKVYSKPYTHCSLAFCLEEISSLFRKKTEDVVNLLIKAYDCGDYTYDTKTAGIDRVKNCCLNFFGGTTPGFMQSTFDDKLLTEGFSSRTFFIYAAKNRKHSLWIPDLTDEQRNAHRDIINHVKHLASLYGRVTIDNDTRNFLENWWEKSQSSRPNTSPKLNPYYARKNIHVQKLALAIHFGESLEMHIPKHCFEHALELLAPEERKMHIALGFDKSNPLSTPSRKILQHLETYGAKTRKELIAEFYEALPNGIKSLDEILEYLGAVNKITSFEESNEVTGKVVEYYRSTMSQAET